MSVLPDGRLHSIVRAAYPVVLDATATSLTGVSKDDYIEDLRNMTVYARQLINGSHPDVNTKCIFVRIIKSTYHPLT